MHVIIMEDADSGAPGGVRVRMRDATVYVTYDFERALAHLGVSHPRFVNELGAGAPCTREMLTEETGCRVVIEHALHELQRAGLRALEVTARLGLRA